MFAWVLCGFLAALVILQRIEIGTLARELAIARRGRRLARARVRRREQDAQMLTMVTRNALSCRE